MTENNGLSIRESVIYNVSRETFDKRAALTTVKRHKRHVFCPVLAQTLALV